MSELRLLVMHLLSCMLGVFAMTGFCELGSLKKPYRPLEVVLVAFSILYGLVGAWLLLENTSRIMQWVPMWLPHTDGFRVVVVNVIFMAGYGLVRLSILGFLRLLQNKPKLLSLAALDFYEQDPISRTWHLKPDLAGLKRFLTWMQWAVMAIITVFLTLCWTYPQQTFTQVTWIPAMVVPLLCAMRSYLDGLPPLVDPKRSYSGSGIDAQDICNYYGLRSVYEDNLPEPLLTSTAGCDLHSMSSALNLIEAWKKTGGPIEQIAAKYYSINHRFANSDPDCALASIDLLKGKNVVFFNPFYKDLSLYLTLPIASTLLAGDHVLILCGRKSLEQPAQRWIEQAISDQTRTEHLWTIRQIDDQKEPCQIGIMTFNQIYNHAVLKNNQEFFQRVGLVILLEPSKLIGTSQIALSIIAENLGGEGHKPVFAVCDRQTTGLIDTLSHVLKSEFIEACASPVPHCLYTAMFWNADGEFRRQEFFDHQSRYLGNGMELAALAIRSQVPKAKWIGETKVPLKDLRRIAGQSYQTLCRFMNIKVSQNALFERVDFIDSLWEPEMEKRPFLIVEDEFNNMFATLHPYLARGTGQSFVHILCENYLLRDYMKANREVFESNPQAIPSLIPDYAKTERNTILKLLLLMNMRSVDEETIAREFRLCGILSHDLDNELIRLLKKYTDADETIFTITRSKKLVNEWMQKVVEEYSISDEEFARHFQSSLKNAYFIVEDELANREYLDARLYGQIVQAILPGQFLCYGGKYYQVHSINPVDGVILRRASDLYDGREYYRQQRIYTLHTMPTDFVSSDQPIPNRAELVSYAQIGSIELRQERHDFDVATPGYLRLKDNHDLEHGVPYLFEQEGKQEIYTRSYLQKTILRLKMPQMDQETILTFCVLLNELFKTIYPENWPYINAAVVYTPQEIDPLMAYVVPQVVGAFDPGEVLVIEDSQMDLGLIDSFVRSFDRLMAVLYDYLDWLDNPETEDGQNADQEVDFSAIIEEMKASQAKEKEKRNYYQRWKAKRALKKQAKQEQDVDNNSDQSDLAESEKGNTQTMELETEAAGRDKSQAEDVVQLTRPVPENWADQKKQGTI